jgi:hypothetical protein
MTMFQQIKRGMKYGRQYYNTDFKPFSCFWSLFTDDLHINFLNVIKWLDDELERLGKWSRPIAKYYLSIHLEWLTNILRNLIKITVTWLRIKSFKKASQA